MVCIVAVTIPYAELTIVFIVLAAIVDAFVRRIYRDKCLRDFSRDVVMLKAASGKVVRGKLRVENAGLEFMYPEKYEDEDGHCKTSYILYKYEYPNIEAVIRFHDELSEHSRKQRDKELRMTCCPGPLRRLRRKMLSIFRKVRDSILEIMSLLVSRAKKAAPSDKVLTAQDKYVTPMKQELIDSAVSSFEPSLEGYIGCEVLLNLINGDKTFEYCGVMKEYTTEFIEILDVNYSLKEGQPARRADLIVPRQLSVVRQF